MIIIAYIKNTHALLWARGMEEYIIKDYSCVSAKAVRAGYVGNLKQLKKELSCPVVHSVVFSDAGLFSWVDLAPFFHGVAFQMLDSFWLSLVYDIVTSLRMLIMAIAVDLLWFLEGRKALLGKRSDGRGIPPSFWVRFFFYDSLPFSRTFSIFFQYFNCIN